MGSNPTLSANQKRSATKPFLKWAGNKYRLIDRILALLPPGRQLIEPFLGSAAVFLNTTYDAYLLNDANADLIALYQGLQREGGAYIDYCRSFFIPKHNQERQYYRLRIRFNESRDPLERGALFLYLNRHGYNGLCRYNLRKKEFNVPFGRYQTPYFPEKEMHAFHHKSTSHAVTFLCEDFTTVLAKVANASGDAVVYCDPPYLPLNLTAYFTSYCAQRFGLKEQTELALLSENLAKTGIPVLISNHCTEVTEQLYRQARIDRFSVRRTISCQGDKRHPVSELLAYFGAQ